MTRHHHIVDALVRYRRRLVSSTAAAVLLAGWVAPAYADATIDAALEGLAPMTSGDLGDERGGFSYGNMNISFGFSISTTVAGGSLGPGVTVTTSFTINTPSDLKNLGTTITSNVQSTLKEKGLVDDGNPSTPTLKDTINDNVAASLANLNPGADPTSAPTATVVTSAPAAAPPAGTAPAALVPVVEVTMASAGDIPAPELAPPPPLPLLPPPPDPSASAAPSGNPELPPALKPEESPASSSSGSPDPVSVASVGDVAPPVDPTTSDTAKSNISASVDPETGNVKLTVGSGNVLFEYLQSQVAKIQNTEDNVVITSEFKADYVIDGYSQIASVAGLNEQVRNLTDQLMALGGH